MANIFKAKTLVGRTGLFSHEVIAPNIVYNTGNQMISGNKTFIENINISGTGTFLNLNLNSISSLNISGVDVYITDGIVYSNQQIYSSNLVYNTGNQNIAGIKNFYSRPTVNGIGVLLSGEAASLPSTIVYTTGDQIIFGDKNFNDKLIAKTGFFGQNNLLSGILITCAGGSGNLISGNYNFIGGGIRNIIFGENSIINGGDSNFIFGNYSILAGGRCNFTTGDYTNIGGGRFNSTIGDFSLVAGGCCNLARGQYSNVFGGRLNCSFATYSSVIGGFNNSSSGCYSIVIGGENNKALAHYSYIIGGKNITITSNHSGAAVFADAQDRNHFSSGENSLVLDFAGGIYFAQPNIYGNLNFNQRPQVNGTGVLLSGEVQNINLPNTIVYTTGNQIISGDKTFMNNLEVQGTGIFNSVDLSNISEFQFSGTNINLLNSNIYVSGGGIYISGNSVLTGIIPSPQILTNIVYTTGNQIISGNKTFINNIAVSGTGFFYNNIDLNSIDLVSISGVDISIADGNINSNRRYTVNGTGVLLSGEAASLPTTIVYTTGNQIISGIKTFNSKPNVNNTDLALSTDVMNFLPKLKSPNIVGVYAPGSAGTATGPATRNRRFSLIYFPASGNVTGLVAQTHINAPNNVNVQLALWNIGEDGLPGAFLTGVTGSIGITANTQLAFPVDVNVSGGFHYMSLTPGSAVAGGSLAAFNPTIDSTYGSFFGKANLTGAALIVNYIATTFNQTTHEPFSYSQLSFLNMGVRYRV